MVGNSPHVTLAMQAIRAYVEQGRVIEVVKSELPEEFLAPSAAFVCIKRDGDLRGCIGTIEPACETLAEEIVMNGISAATRDPRFLPVETDELDELECSVDVLYPPEEIEDKCMLDPMKYGVIVHCGNRRGLLLPDLEGVDTVDLQIDIARRKAGIALGEKLRLYRFEVKRFY